ncbi:MAG: serine/threonine protein kinase [Blautia sp.]|nr:serine/threonine protein kinase [Lachnoclostridium sp.]MCM1211556.1 serine/threonine protein kinase [Blautia sp.]
MLNLDRTATETLLGRLEEGGYLFPQYRFHKVDGQLQPLGKGGFSVVYEAVDKDVPENRYAVKVIGLERHVITSDAFQKTIALQRYLSGQSPYILRIIDVRELCVALDEDGALLGVYGSQEKNWNEEGTTLQFILMEKLECILVKDKFKNTSLIRDSLQEEEEILKFATQIGQAIQTAHNNSVLHRDIKLENIFWDDKEKSYKLGDFGIAKYVEGGNAETIVYTDGYGAPEIERRLSDSYNVTADIYSFGISLYLLLNELRFPGSNGYYVNLVQYDPNFIFPAPGKASDDLTRVIRKMCSYQREDRYQSMAEVLSDLQYASERAGILDDVDCEELTDIATETYRDESQSREQDEESAILPDTPGISRAQRKQYQKRIDAQYNQACIRYLLGLSALFMLLMKGMQTEVSFVTDWQFFILPVFVFATAMMQQIKDFHRVSGMASLLFGIYSGYKIGFQVPHFILLTSVVTGVPVLTGAGVLGTGAWMLLAVTGKLSWLDFLAKHDFVWIVIIITFLTVNGFMKLRWKLGKSSDYRAYTWVYLYDKIPLFMMISGILLSLLQRLEIITISEPVQKMHLIRTGILLLTISAFMLWWSEDTDEESGDETDKIKEDGEEIAEDNVPMDK